MDILLSTLTPSKRTLAKRLLADGFTIISGNAPDLDRSSKWASHDVVRILKSNGNVQGRTLWAVRQKATQPAQAMDVPQIEGGQE